MAEKEQLDIETPLFHYSNTDIEENPLNNNIESSIIVQNEESSSGGVVMEKLIENNSMMIENERKEGVDGRDVDKSVNISVEVEENERELGNENENEEINNEKKMNENEDEKEKIESGCKDEEVENDFYYVEERGYYVSRSSEWCYCPINGYFYYDYTTLQYIFMEKEQNVEENKRKLEEDEKEVGHQKRKKKEKHKKNKKGKKNSRSRSRSRGRSRSKSRSRSRNRNKSWSQSRSRSRSRSRRRRSKSKDRNKDKVKRNSSRSRSRNRSRSQSRTSRSRSRSARDWSQSQSRSRSRSLNTSEDEKKQRERSLERKKRQRKRSRERAKIREKERKQNERREREKERKEKREKREMYKKLKEEEKKYHEYYFTTYEYDTEKEAWIDRSTAVMYRYDNPLGKFIVLPQIRLVVESITDTQDEGDKITTSINVGHCFVIGKSGATIGRDRSDEPRIRLRDLSVSKFHSQIFYEPQSQEFQIVDHGSQNGTFINDNRLSYSKCNSPPFTLSDGDSLKIGFVSLIVHYHTTWPYYCTTCASWGSPEQSLGPIEYWSRAHAIKKPKAETSNNNNSNVGKSTSNVKIVNTKSMDSVKNNIPVKIVNNVSKSNSPEKKDTVIYRDRAEERRKLYGSSHGLDEINLRKIEFPELQISYSEVSIKEEIVEEKIIGDENKGKMLLKSLGWSEGEGLGKNNEGIKEPIKVNGNQETYGLGFVQQQETEKRPFRLNFREATKKALFKMHQDDS
mgnify:CR=1 FL=1